MPRPLNPKQLKFVERYLATGNASKSYSEAFGVKDSDSAKAAASRLLTSVNVKAAIDAANSKAVENAELTAEWWVKGVMGEATYHGEGSQHSARIKAYELLAKRLFPDGPPPGVPETSEGLSFESVARILAALAGGSHPAGGASPGAPTTDDPLL